MTTVQDYASLWLERRALEGRISAASAAQYEVTFRRHVFPHIGTMPIAEFTTPVARQFLLTLVDRSLLSMPSVRSVRSRLKAMLDDAVDEALLPSNPLAGLTLGREKTSVARLMTQEQLMQLLTYVRRHYLGPIVRLALSTGLGRRELVELRWGQVDLKARSIQVVLGGKERLVPIPKDMAEELQQMRVQAAHKAALGGHDLADRHVLMTGQGKTWSLSGLTNRMRTLFADAGLQGFHLQDLRHSHAAALIRSRVSMKDVAERLGHYDHRVTRKIYGHLNRESRHG